MTGSNLPPGVRDCDIPGDRPEDQEWEDFHEQIDRDCNELGLHYAEQAQVLWNQTVLRFKKDRARKEELVRPIKVGDKVNILYTDESVHPDAEVLHVPQDVGDLWYFKLKDGQTFGLNPLSSVFHSMTKAGS